MFSWIFRVFSQFSAKSSMSLKNWRCSVLIMPSHLYMIFCLLERDILPFSMIAVLLHCSIFCLVIEIWKLCENAEIAENLAAKLDNHNFCWYFWYFHAICSTSTCGCMLQQSQKMMTSTIMMKSDVNLKINKSNACSSDMVDAASWIMVGSRSKNI